MDLKEIKTLDELYEVGDIWYQRSHKLRVIWQDRNETEERINKAFALWTKLYTLIINAHKLIRGVITVANSNIPRYKDCDYPSIKSKIKDSEPILLPRDNQQLGSIEIIKNK